MSVNLQFSEKNTLIKKKLKQNTICIQQPFHCLAKGRIVIFSEKILIRWKKMVLTWYKKLNYAYEDKPWEYLTLLNFQKLLNLQNYVSLNDACIARAAAQWEIILALDSKCVK